MRLRSLITVNPPKSEVAHLPSATEVTFAPMEALADGLGGLDTSITKTIGEVGGGSYSYFAEGDVLLAKVTPCFENGKKAIAHSLINGIGFATSEVHVIRPDVRRLHRGYLRYLLCSEDFRAAGMASMTGAGGLRRVSEDAIRNFRLPTTDLDAQKSIADFLDCETARIDQLIEKKQRQLRALAEKQNAIVSRAFAALREEGRPIFRLRHLLSSPLQYGANEAAVSDDRSAIRFIRITDLTEEGALRDETYKSLPLEIAKPYLLRDGDVLFARSGATVGKTFIYRESLGPACFAGYLIRARPKRQLIDPDFLKLRTEAKDYWDFVTSANIQATIQNVSAERYAALQFPLPPMERQLRLVEQLARIKTATKTVSKKIEASINRLHELRSTLITAAVTGQIDAATWGKRSTTDRRLDAIEADMATAAQSERQQVRA